MAVATVNWSLLRLHDHKGYFQDSADGVRLHYSNNYVRIRAEQKTGRVVARPDDPDYGKPGTFYNITAARMRAMDEARQKARLKLSTVLEKIRVDASSRLGDWRQRHESFNRDFQMIIHDAPIFNSRVSTNSVAVELVLPFTGRGGLLHYLPRLYEKRPLPAYPEEEFSDEYTSLIVDVSHLPFRFSLNPRLFTEDGREVYGPDYVSKNYAVETGLAGYALSLEKARELDRAGARPLYTRGLQTRAPSHTDVVVADEEIARILAVAGNRKQLFKCRLIFVVAPGDQRVAWNSGL